MVRTPSGVRARVPSRGNPTSNRSSYLQNDSSNRASPITIVAAITSHTEERRVYVTNVPVAKGDGGLPVASLVLTNQLRSVDRRRLIRRLGTFTSETIRRVDRAIAISLGLTEL